ncbi:MAG: hypothetical protein JWQ44_526 [Chthoniobacter sp.]|jgi:lipid A 3-O-deacylase|nr:hypothetical protein [Chthoniobacter sp.]
MSSILTRSLLLLSLALPTLAVAGEELDGGTFSVYFENDLFTGTDRYYTNGVKLGWSSTDLAKYGDTPYASPLLPILERIPFINNPAFQKNLSFSLGQNIYTPDNTEALERLDDDRPYAGWLYLGFGVAWKNADIRHSLSLNIGVVGSWSYGEEAQRVVHEARGLAVPKGWDNQLHNELGVLLAYEATWRWPKHERRVGLDWEFLPHLGFSVGNVLTAVNVGGEFRFGVNLPDDFGTPGIEPSATTSTPVEGAERAGRARKFDLGMYLFARADGRAIAHTVFLDGNTFGNSASADKKVLVADLSVGASLNYKDTKVTYAVIYRTQEFEAQEEAQLFGSVSFNFAF